MISNFSSRAAKTVATNFTFLPEVFNHLTAKKFASCIVVKFKKSLYFSVNTLTQKYVTDTVNDSKVRRNFDQLKVSSEG